MNLKDLAWAAGFFEGEGCFSKSKTSYKQVAAVSGTDLDRLEEFKRIVGFGTIVSAGKIRSERHKQCYTWHAAKFENFQALVAMLWCRLGPRRRARAKQILLETGPRKPRGPAPKAFCKRGHERSGANIYVDPKRGKRYCKPCRDLQPVIVGFLRPTSVEP